MDSYLEVALIECLDALEQGQPIDQVLARYPELAAELRPMLETAVTLPQINVQPSLAAQHHSRNTFLAQAAAQKEAKSAQPSASGFNLRRILMPITSLALVVILFAAGLGPLSAGALPGDALYGAKILVENARSAFTANPATDAALTEQFNQRRIQEIKALLAENRAANVAFTGEIEAVQAGLWTISGFATEINNETQVFGGDPLVGQMAMVNGRTTNGSLIATTITLLPTNIHGHIDAHGNFRTDGHLYLYANTNQHKYAYNDRHSNSNALSNGYSHITTNRNRHTHPPATNKEAVRRQRQR